MESPSYSVNMIHFFPIQLSWMITDSEHYFYIKKIYIIGENAKFSGMFTVLQEVKGDFVPAIASD